jgi:hypothetical protein
MAPTGTSLPLLSLLSPALGGGPGALLVFVELGAELDVVVGREDVETSEVMIDGLLLEEEEEVDGVVMVDVLIVELVLAGTDTGVGARICCPAWSFTSQPSNVKIVFGKALVA